MNPSIAGDGKRDGFALAKEAGTVQPLALIVGGELRDLAFVPPSGEAVTVVGAASEEGREVLRHSAAHVLAQAVLRLYANAKYSIGPPIQDGFYYDFDVAEPFTPEDLAAIEEEMNRIVAENQRFERAEVGRAEALQLFADQPYKIEIIQGVAQGADALDQQGAEGEVISVYRNTVDGETRFIDLCRGPHIPGTGRLKAFKLLRSAGAYWRGDEKRQMLQRIYGTAWESEKALEEHLHRLEEAERRDHRKLGRELELYSWPEEVGPGLAVWHPNGAIVRKELEDLARNMHLARGYLPVHTPNIGKSLLWETSGHLDHYSVNMYPAMSTDEADYYAKPMNCPFHILVYRSKTRSYRDLPLRLSELGTVYRFERSGVVHGLLRSRGFTQDDSHIFCRPDQVVDEMLGVLDFFRDLYGIFGFTPDRVDFSTRPEDSMGDDEEWDLAEKAITDSLDKAGLGYVRAEGEGTYYGPKIDIHVRDAIGRMWQMCTVQVDVQLPQRFDLEYVDADGSRKRPVMIHRALYGSVERFMGVLVEHFAGAFPTWLAPVQATIIPIADRHGSYADEVLEDLRADGYRITVDDSDNTMRAKIRNAQMAKIPYMLVVGDDEAGSRTVSVRTRSGGEERNVPVPEFRTRLRHQVEERSLDL